MALALKFQRRVLFPSRTTTPLGGAGERLGKHRFASPQLTHVLDIHAQPNCFNNVIKCRKNSFRMIITMTNV